MNILLSSVGRRAYLVRYFQQVLAGAGKVIATNCLAEATGMFIADISEVVPPGKDPSFIETILDVCRRHKVKMLFSLHDWEAPYISAHKQQFLDAGVIPVIADPNIVEICLDKYKTYLFAQKHSIPAIKTYIDIKILERDILSGDIGYPLIIKPRFGQGSIGLTKVWGPTQLFNAYESLIQEFKTHEFDNIIEQSCENSVVIQPFLDGQEYGADIINDLNGNFVTCFVKKKLAMRAGETDVSETLSEPKIESVAQKISGLTRHPGIMDSDFFLTENNDLFLLEMNPRFGGGYPFSHEAGANIPAALVAWAQGNEPDQSCFKLRYGIRTYKDISLLSFRI